MNPLSRFITAALTGSCLVSALAAAPQFVSGPSARYGHSMAYDSTRQVVVLFGGRDQVSSGIFDETWEWDGSSWTQRTPATKPPPSAMGAMVYDVKRSVCVYFGGQDHKGNLNETWHYDGITWTQVVTASAPAPRTGHAMAYDIARDKTVLFGGHDPRYKGDTWEFDGRNWVEAKPTTVPPRRNGATAAYDTLRDRVVIFGGYDFFGNPPSVKGYCDLWAFDGATWQQVHNGNTPKPRGCWYGTFGYMPTSDQFCHFGGWGGGWQSEVWSFSAGRWQLSNNSSISPIARMACGQNWVYDEARGELFLFGGYKHVPFEVYGDTWTFDGTEWRPKLDYQTSPINGARYALTPPMTWSDAEAVAVLDGGHLATVRSQAEQNWLWNAFGGPTANVWIGLNDPSGNGNFVWSSGESAPWRNWAFGQPNQKFAGNRCHLWYDAKGKWGDDPNSRLYPAIIELPGKRAASTKVGTGCIAAGVPPTLFATPPVQGRECFLIASSLLPNTAGVILMGIQHKGIPLSPKCTAYFDITLPSVPIFFSTDATGGWLSPPIAVSTSLSLNGVELALQAALANLPTAPFGMALSNGVWATIGY